MQLFYFYLGISGLISLSLIVQPFFIYPAIFFTFVVGLMFTHKYLKKSTAHQSLIVE